MFSFSWAVTVGSGTCYSRGHLLVLQCPGGPSRTLHVSRRKLFPLPRARGRSIGWAPHSRSVGVREVIAGVCPALHSELPEPCCKSQSRNGDTDLGHWLRVPVCGACSGSLGTCPKSRLCAVKAPSLSAGLWHECPTGSHRDSFNP